MSSDVVLTSALRSNLLSLQKTQSNIDKVQNALATGLKVSSALDNPQSFFAARSLNNRASDLSGLLDGIGQSISGIKQANTSVEKLTKLVEQADSIITQAADAAAEARIAAVTGTVDLSDVTSITQVSGVNAGDTLNISITNPENALVTYDIAVVLSAGDSIDQVLAKINAQGTPTPGSEAGSYNSAGEAVVEASLTADGNLKIAAANGGKIRVEFEAIEGNTSTDDAVNLAFARGLGFTQAQLANVAGDATDQDVLVTAVAGNALVSGSFYKAGGSSAGFADASDLLSIVDSSDGTNRFVSSPTAGSDNLQLIVNNTTTVNIAIQSGVTTIQGLVDSINNNATLKNIVHAEYDATTGQFSIEKTGASVKTIEVRAASSGVLASTFTVDFDFGLSASLSSTTNTFSASEVFSFGDASGQLAQLERDFDKVRDQIDQLVDDSPYTGANLLKGETLTTYFNADRSNALDTVGQDLTTVGLGIEEADFAGADAIDSYRTAVKGALDTLRAFGGSLANDLSIIQAREEFTKETINNLTEGADKLTVADQNEEGAKLLALQTRQQLGVTALSLAAQAQQSVLRLF